jgi:peptidylprolyl isomerase/FKBP-type peptidyl-prolyl cis-trans isomerase FkpA
VVRFVSPAVVLEEILANPDRADATADRAFGGPYGDAVARRRDRTTIPDRVVRKLATSYRAPAAASCADLEPQGATLRYSSMVLLLLVACGGDEASTTTSPIGNPPSTPDPNPASLVSGDSIPPTETVGPAAPRQTAKDHPGLGIKVLREGTGDTLEWGMEGRVHYTGVLRNGKQFDSSIGRAPFAVRLQEPAGVIRGWVLGLEGMRVGEKRVLTIPPELGYGKSGSGQIPADATLVFTIELLEIVK